MIKVEINNRPTFVPLSYNGYYKLVILLALINYCAYSKKASIDLIHIIFWSLRTETNYQVLKDFSNQTRNTLVPWSFEQGIEQVLSLGLINRYIKKVITQNNLEIALTATGEEVVKRINEYELFRDEIIKIVAIGKVSKSRLTKANEKWAML